MTATIVAHVSDAHLGQHLPVDGDIDGGAMRYVPEPDAHKAHLRRVLEDVTSQGISHLVFGGDIGAPSAVPDFFALLDEYDVTTSLVLGNHDTGLAGRVDITAGAVDGKLCSARDDARWRWITLDSSDNAIGDVQLAWLAGALEGAERIVLFVHHPVLAVATPLDRSGAALRDRETLAALLKSAACEVTLFCGHYHMVDEARDGNLRQFVTPAVSYQVVKHADRLRVDRDTFGYRIVMFDGPVVTTRVVLLTEPAPP